MSGDVEEKWKDVVGYEGLYEVSNTGEVRRNGRKLKPALSCGYKVVNLSKNGKERTYLVHRLVATAFVPNLNGDNCVNHIDEQPLNNNASNLEWCSVAYNNRYGTKPARIRKKLSKPVVSKIIKTGEEETWESAEAAARELVGYSTANICEALHGKRKTAFKRTWRYL